MKQRTLPGAYQRYLAARFLGVMGSNMIAVALGWQMYDLTGSAWNLGLVGLVQFLPALALTVPAGLLVDTADRRQVFAASLALQGLACMVLGWGSWAGWVGRDAILAVCLLIGVARSLQMPAQQAMIPALVPQQDLPRALAVNASFNKMSMIGGPALGGALYGFGADAVYGVCAAVFVLSAVLAMMVPRAVSPKRAAPAITWSAMFAGIGFIWGHPVVLGSLVLDLFATLMGGSMALLPMFAKDFLQTGAWGLGLLRAAPAIGGLVMTMLMARWPMERQVGRRMFGAVLAYGMATMAFSQCTSMVAALVALAAIGAADIVSTVLRHSVVQVETPDALRGRVAAVHATSISASNQLGQFRAGVVAEWTGPAAAVLAGGVAIVLTAAACARLFPALRERDGLTAGKCQ